MVTKDYIVIRSVDVDDAELIHSLYDWRHPRSWMLDRKRELLTPTLSEMRELLTQKESPLGALNAIEDKTGQVLGFCVLRGIMPDAGYAEVLLMFIEPERYSSVEADEAMAYLIEEGFKRKRLNKVISHCLDDEHHFRSLLIRTGFYSNGIQREVLYTAGCWHGLETLSLFRADLKEYA